MTRAAFLSDHYNRDVLGGADRDNDYANAHLCIVEPQLYDTLPGQQTALVLEDADDPDHTDDADDLDDPFQRSSAPMSQRESRTSPS